MKYYALSYGLIVWVGLAWFTGRAEAWDSDAYFIYGLPLLLLGVAFMGYTQPALAWQWGLWLTLGHAIGILGSGLYANASFGLLPFTIIAAAIIAVPAVLFAALGGFIGRVWPHK